MYFCYNDLRPHDSYEVDFTGDWSSLLKMSLKTIKNLFLDIILGIIPQFSKIRNACKFDGDKA